MDAFPTIHDLAKTSEERVLRLWQGLGYYSRAKNLHKTAKHISENMEGVFPNTYSEIIKLKGVGPYTASAIASICFNETTPVVDGNVYRFSSRYFGIQKDISKSGASKIYEGILKTKIPKKDPGLFNQAMMEFGATICTPKPQCGHCIFQMSCFAKNNDIQKLLPIKTRISKVRNRFFNYLVFTLGDTFLLKKRNEIDIWEGLFDFYLIEGQLNKDSVLKIAQQELLHSAFIANEVTKPVIHLLTNQKIHTHFYEIKTERLELIIENSNLKLYSVKNMLNLPKPMLIVNYLRKVGIK